MCTLLQSHHKPREGPFELNDVFAIINAFPAIALLAYGFFNKGFVPGLCFGAVKPLPWKVSPMIGVPLLLCIHLLIKLWDCKRNWSFCAGLRYYNVWYGIHVCARWSCTQTIPCRTDCRGSIPPKSGSGTSGLDMQICVVEQLYHSGNLHRIWCSGLV